jgi:hypothetical protein
MRVVSRHRKSRHRRYGGPHPRGGSLYLAAWKTSCSIIDN